MINYNKTEQFLLDAPLPERTESYIPVPHRTFITQLQERIQKRNLIIVNKRYLSNQKGNVMQGEFVIHSTKDPELFSMFSFLNSYNKTQRATLNGGAFNKVCENGLYLNNLRFTRKHTGTVLEELFENMELSLDSAEKQLEELIYVKNELRGVRLTKTQTAELLGILYIDKEIITSTQLNIVKRELEKPTFDYKAPNTAYELLNHLTHSFKNCPPHSYMKSHIETSNFFVNQFGILDARNIPVSESFNQIEDAEIIEETVL
jgi:hypothetical protein